MEVETTSFHSDHSDQSDQSDQVDQADYSDRLVGAHLSTAGGLNKGVDRAVAIGANALQIFAGSPRSWQVKPIIAKELQEFRQYAKNHGVREIFIHSLYLINLASPNKELVQKSKNNLVHQLKLGGFFGCAGVVVHLGSHLGRGWESCRQDTALLIKRILAESDGSVPLLIENSAGQKGKLTSDLSEIRWLLDEVDHPNLGWCYDTCHGWAAGYSPSQGIDVLQKIGQLELWDTLRCLHVNDSRDELASGRDRHDNILEGKIPQADFQQILNHPEMNKVPIITEAPGFDGKGPDKQNIEAILSLLD